MNAIWRWPYVQNCSQLRYFSRGTGTACFQTVRRERQPEAECAAAQDAPGFQKFQRSNFSAEPQRMPGCTVLHRCDSPHDARKGTSSGRRHSATTAHTAHPLEAPDRCRLLALACRSPWPMPYTCGLCPMRYFERVSSEVARRGEATGGFRNCTPVGTAGGPISFRSAVGLDVAYFQRIELVDGDGSSRFEKLAVDFDEGRIS